MKEVKPGPNRKTPVRTVPKDAMELTSVDSYKLHLTASERSLVIETTSYHPGTLYVSLDDLLDIVDRLREEIAAAPPKPYLVRRVPWHGD